MSRERRERKIGAFRRAACLAALAAAFAAAAQPLHVEKLGDGERTVLFLPGLHAHADLWRPWAESLAAADAGYRALLATPAGFAGVPPQGLENGFQASVLPALAALLREEDARDATVVGHSIGGLLALMLARREPHRVGGVLVVNSLPFLAELFMPGATPRQAAERAEAIAREMVAGDDAGYRESQAGMLAGMTKTRAFLPTLKRWLATSHRPTSAAAFKDALAMDFRPALPEIAQPVLALAAWDAAMGIPKSRMESLFASQYDGLPNGRVRVVEGSLHFAMIDQRPAFDAALEEALDR